VREDVHRGSVLSFFTSLQETVAASDPGTIRAAT
jgi:hypothetical protein